MTNPFQCTQCGQCCHDLNIPLTAKETIDWISGGNPVKVLVEAIPWSEETLQGNELLKRKKQITFAALSGSLTIRVQVTFLGHFLGACPNLDSQLHCGIYEKRPLTCRIYPFEMSPHIAIEPNNKLCPDEAWNLPKRTTTSIQQVPLQISIIDPDTDQHIRALFTQNTTDVAIKELLCRSLGISSASLSNDGYLFHHVNQNELRSQLQFLLGNALKTTQNRDIQDWLIVSQNDSTRSDLTQIGGRTAALDKLISREEYLHFQ
jgi:Fe-S-cluster containining protein